MDNKEYFKKIVSIVSEKSTCRRLQVGAILVKDGRIISTGWNGVPSGFEHCSFGSLYQACIGTVLQVLHLRNE